MPHGIGNRPRREPVRLVQDQRHAKRRLVGEQAVRHLAVLAERLAVIGGEHHERVASSLRVQHRLQEGPERSVDRRHFAEIWRVAIPRRIRLGRRVREVRLVHVDPRQPRRPRRAGGRGRGRILAPDPLERGGDGVRTAALRDAERDVRLVLRKPIVVDVEAARQTEAGVERKSADEGAGPVVAPAHQRRERLDGGREPEAGVLAHAVAEGVQTGEDVRVRRQRDDTGGAGLGEADAGGGEPIDPRRRGRSVAVGANRVSAQRVDGDQLDVGRGAPLGSSAAAGGGE